MCLFRCSTLLWLMRAPTTAAHAAERPSSPRPPSARCWCRAESRVARKSLKSAPRSFASRPGSSTSWRLLLRRTRTLASIATRLLVFMNSWYLGSAAG